jgi:two-component system phosphate regulon sensor histidine kinase PhoR
VSVNLKDNLEVMADEAHLQNAFLNILDNANKYCSQKPSIIVDVSRVQQFAVLDFSDNGIGLDKAAQKRIFEKFFRVSTGDLHTVKGFGLGLSYVHSVITAHNGQIELSSKPGKGSRFRIKLPLA